jgi:isoquinoline 1-oxidoreductase alpha subunit
MAKCTASTSQKTWRWVLRDLIELTDTNSAAAWTLCGACTVHVDGQATRSCVLPVSAAAGKRVTTIEAIGETDAGLALKALSETSSEDDC